jgi:hypothetical protein
VQYIEDLSGGKHDPQWLAEANAAHDLRLAGEFDGFLKRKLAEDWDVVFNVEDQENDSPLGLSTSTDSPGAESKVALPGGSPLSKETINVSTCD